MTPPTSTRRALTAGLACLVTLAGHELAHATEADDHREAARLFAEGEDHYDHKRFDEARKAWARSLDKVVRHSTACNLAAVEQRLGDALSAARHYQLCIDEMPADEPKEFRARARKKLDEARAELGTLELEAPPGATLRVTGAPVGAKSRVAYVAPGSYEVAGEHEGRRASKTVRVGKGETQRVRLELSAPLAVEPAPTPVGAAAAPSIAAAPLSPPASTPPPGTPAPRVASYVALVGAVSAAAAGAALLGLGASKGDTAASLREGFSSSSCAGASTPRCDALRAAVGESREWMTAGAVLLGAAGALGGLSLGLSLVKSGEGKRHEPTTLRLTPGVSPAGAFLGAALTF